MHPLETAQIIQRGMAEGELQLKEPCVAQGKKDSMSGLAKCGRLKKKPNANRKLHYYVKSNLKRKCGPNRHKKLPTLKQGKRDL